MRPAWKQAIVPVVALLFGLAGGGIAFVAGLGSESVQLPPAVAQDKPNAYEVRFGSPPAGPITRPDTLPAQLSVRRDLTPERCMEIRTTFDATTAAIAAHVTRGMSADQLARFNTEVERSREWAGAGCPPHPVYGAYTDQTGTATELRILDPAAFQ